MTNDRPFADDLTAMAAGRGAGRSGGEIALNTDHQQAVPRIRSVGSSPENFRVWRSIVEPLTKDEIVEPLTKDEEVWDREWLLYNEETGNFWAADELDLLTWRSFREEGDETEEDPDYLDVFDEMEEHGWRKATDLDLAVARGDVYDLKSFEKWAGIGSEDTSPDPSPADELRRQLADLPHQIRVQVREEISAALARHPQKPLEAGSIHATNKCASRSFAPFEPKCLSIAVFMQEVTQEQVEEFRSLLTRKGLSPNQGWYDVLEVTCILSDDYAHMDELRRVQKETGKDLGQVVRKACREGRIEARRKKGEKAGRFHPFEMHFFAIMYKKYRGLLPWRTEAK